jgi:ketosteroid isomerase-like protein
MTISGALSSASTPALGRLEASRADFLAALASAPDEALTYCPPGEDYALGGLIEHVAGVIRHYTSVLVAMRGAGSGELRVADSTAEQDMAAIAAGLSASERGTALRRLSAAHVALVSVVRQLGAEEFGRATGVVYGSAEAAYPTSASDILGWVDQHYREHAEQIGALLEQWNSETTRTLDVVQHFGAVFNSRDVAAIMALMSEDCVFEDTEPPPDGTRYVGAAAVGTAWHALFDGSQEARFTTEEVFACGDRAVVRWRYDWTGGHVRGVDVLRVHDGLVTEKLAYVKG